LVRQTLPHQTLPNRIRGSGDMSPLHRPRALVAASMDIMSTDRGNVCGSVAGQRDLHPRPMMCLGGAQLEGVEGLDRPVSKLAGFVRSPTPQRRVPLARADMLPPHRDLDDARAEGRQLNGRDAERQLLIETLPPAPEGPVLFSRAGVRISRRDIDDRIPE